MHWISYGYEYFKRNKNMILIIHVTMSTYPRKVIVPIFTYFNLSSSQLFFISSVWLFCKLHSVTRALSVVPTFGLRCLKSFTSLQPMFEDKYQERLYQFGWTILCIACWVNFFSGRHIIINLFIIIIFLIFPIKQVRHFKQIVFDWGKLHEM